MMGDGNCVCGMRRFLKLLILHPQHGRNILHIILTPAHYIYVSPLSYLRKSECLHRSFQRWLEMRRLDGFEGRQVKWVGFPDRRRELSELIEIVVIFSSAVETERAVVNVGGNALDAQKNVGRWQWAMLVEEDV
mmetsp:Transcript_30730/g.50220  ORF Transcript_30730/g.50220 Transcript_30730/m.50220 type:complete len:134 (-) Transcript_30730:162-563(-)